MREQPTTSGKIVATVNEGTPLQPTGEQSEVTQAMVLRSVLYDEHWLEVTTPDGQQGWVYGGAVKQKGENKGNAVLSPTRFDYPGFVAFDLSQWQLAKKTSGDGEGDFDETRRVYRKGNEKLEVDHFTGEYGYGYTYRLYQNDRLQKERRFPFNNDARKLTEEVIDYTGGTPSRKVREQPTSLTAYQLRDNLPLMVRGPWLDAPYRPQSTQ